MPRLSKYKQYVKCKKGICTIKTDIKDYCEDCKKQYNKLKGAKYIAPAPSPITPSKYYMTLQEIANELGVSREAVRQIESRALRKLNENAQYLKEWIDD